jgi:hypothetical protein
MGSIFKRQKPFGKVMLRFRRYLPYIVTSSPSNLKRCGAFFCKRLTSQSYVRRYRRDHEQRRTGHTPFSYFEILQPFRVADASAFGTGLSA